MTLKTSTIVSGLLIASTTLLSNIAPAKAAGLIGDVLVSPFPPPAGVRLIGTGESVAGIPLTEFDFLPPNESSFGGLIQNGANPNPGSLFNLYTGNLGIIKDLTSADFATLSAGGTVQLLAIAKDPETELTLADLTSPSFTNIGYTFTLQSLGTPVYSQNLGGTTVSLGLTGFFTHYGDGSGDITPGRSTVSIDFAGLNPTDVQALFDEPGESADRTFNWSANIEAVPEPMTMLGVASAAGLGGLFRKMRKNK